MDLITAAAAPSLVWQEKFDSGARILIPPRLGRVRGHDGGYAPVDILARFPSALKKWDLIHAFEHRPNVALPALLSKLRSTPLVSDWSDWWTKGGITTSRRRFAWIDRWEGTLLEEGTKRLSDVVTVVSKALWERALAIGIPEGRVSLVPSGCDHVRIVPRDKTECRRELSLPTHVPILCFVGFAFWDFDFLIEAYRVVLAEFPETNLLVVGEDKEGEIEGIARRRLGTSASQVHFLGRFDPERLSLPLGAADIQLLPLPDNLANRARWPIKFGDYLASGRPTVASDVGDAPRILEEEEAGIAAEPTPEGMAHGILRLLQDPRAMETMGEKARRLAEGKLSWEAQSAKLEEVYLLTAARRKH